MTDINYQGVFDSDEDGLLDTPDKATKVTSADRLERSFLEIVAFYRDNERVPSSETRQIGERKLGARLDGILADETKIAALKDLDEFGLLAEPEAPASIGDLLDGDELGLLDDDSGILDTSGLPQRVLQNPADFVAQRERAEDFEQFEPLFAQKHDELRSGAAKLVPFSGQKHIVEGAFFVLNGVMLFVADVRDPEYKESTSRAYRRERLRCVFENGTESSMYRQSLSIRLGEAEGQIVVPTDFGEVFADDVETGYIYVLRSLSDDPQVANVQDLYKIGFSRGPVEKRIAGAVREPTYLMAPVEIVASYRTYNLKTSALEHLLHQVFSHVRLNVSQVGKDGRMYEPSEWFVVPLPVIDHAIELITDGGIVDYIYDAQRQALIQA